ncbi:MAG TPA: PA0069 family radical SAM protein, partial [Nitrococcus sp.]|nr:PA0069 family radical SAM protein [Nitrococcus sp.]
SGGVGMSGRNLKQAKKGRGAVSNRPSRYNITSVEAVKDTWDAGGEPSDKLRTEVFRDSSRSIITYNRSPDIPFDRSINPFKGCEHACAYCFARPTHAYLGLSPGLDFESKIFAKFDAAVLLLKELAKPAYGPAAIALGANTDPYQPIERKLKITRGILQVLHDCHHPVTIVTKSALVERDIDLLASMAQRRLAQVAISITSLDAALSRRLEPRAPAPPRRVHTIKALTDAGIPVTALFAPVIPALNDSQMEKVLSAAHAAGAQMAGYVLLRLPLEVNEIFQEWLSVHTPLKAGHIMSLVRQMREGRVYQSEFGARMRGKGLFAELIQKRFRLACERLGLNQRRLDLDCSQFVPPRQPGEQLPLF